MAKSSKTKKEIRAAYKKRLAANAAYNKATYKTFSFRMHLAAEADLIKWLDEIPDKKAYFTRLILLDMKREARRQKNENKDL